MDEARSRGRDELQVSEEEFVAASVHVHVCATVKSISMHHRDTATRRLPDLLLDKKKGSFCRPVFPS